MSATQSSEYGRTATFTITGAAAPKERARARIVQPKGKPPFVQLYTPAETRKYEERVKALAQRAWHGAPTERPVEMQVTIYEPIPDSWPRWKVEAAQRQEIVPTGKPDIDNVLKAISDAMNGVVYKDDAQVFSIDPLKIYAPPGADGYIEVTVRENWRCPSSITRKDQLVLLR